MDGKGIIIGLYILRVVFFHGEKTAKSVAVPVQQESGKQPGRPAVAVIVWMNCYKLIMSQSGYYGPGNSAPLRLAHPYRHFGHQSGNIPGFRRHINDSAGGRIFNHVLPAAVRRRLGAFPFLNDSVKSFD